MVHLTILTPTWLLYWQPATDYVTSFCWLAFFHVLSSIVVPSLFTVTAFVMAVGRNATLTCRHCCMRHVHHTSASSRGQLCLYFTTLASPFYLILEAETATANYKYGSNDCCSNILAAIATEITRCKIFVSVLLQVHSYRNFEIKGCFSWIHTNLWRQWSNTLCELMSDQWGSNSCIKIE